ncbi:MAG: FAD-binding oxidoreductase [Caldilineaceae bacterium]|nr:FAD-binding oxidoreductase [Caldilineaceae bacterium]
MTTTHLLSRLRATVGEEHVSSDARTLRQGSQDFYWFSPILKPLLAEKQADVIVRPGSVDELIAVIQVAVETETPLTLRGAGTGNYGQGIPMQGGILINTKRLDQILELTANYARVQAGTLLHTIESAAREIGAELRFFPSTLQTATAGGFLAGGSGGIGSVTWGTLWDEGNVLGATVVTIEAEPRLLTVTDADELKGVIHNCGLTCVIVDLTLALAPAQPWAQYVAAFDDFESALRCGEALAYDDDLPKRLITALEWPIPSFFRQLVKDGACPDGKAVLLLHLTLSPDEVQKRITPFGGSITWRSPHENYGRRGWQLSDFSWNHTTLWAIKADESFTYLQDMFDPGRVHEQLRQRKDRYGDAILEHIEFMKFGGRMVPQGLTLVRFRSPEQIRELIEYCESIGIWVANPHTHYLDEDVRWNGQPILDARARWDPHGLLNPGHLRAIEEI